MGKSSSSESEYDKAKRKYEEAIQQYTGEAGYKTALNTAIGATKNLSNIASQGAIAQAQTGARQSGMSKAQAAMLGSQQGSTAYQNAFNNNISNQQNQAFTSNLNKVSALGSKVGQDFNKLTADRQNDYNNVSLGFGAAGTVLGLSDERLKNYKIISKKIKRSPNSLKVVIKEKGVED